VATDAWPNVACTRWIGHPEARHVKQFDQGPVPRVLLEGDHAVHVALGQDVFGERVFELGELDRGRHIKAQVPYAVSEGKKGLDGGHVARLRGLSAGVERVRKHLDVAQRLADEGRKLSHVARVRLFRVVRFLVQPYGDDLSVAVRASDG